jgi:hypothetical protein
LDGVHLGTNKTKQNKTVASYPSPIQTNPRMLESMGTDDAIQELKHDEIDITMVPSSPSWLKIKLGFICIEMHVATMIITK